MAREPTFEEQQAGCLVVMVLAFASAYGVSVFILECLKIIYGK